MTFCNRLPGVSGGVVGVLALLALCSACNVPGSAEPSAKPAVSAAAPTALAPQLKPSAASPPGVAPGAAGAPRMLAASTLAPRAATESSLKVKRFVVATAVADREPLTSDDALPGDGTAIYAFAELANPAGDSENVRITFERKGGAERVGDVTLPVPGKVERHRTWAFTRYIRTAGVWEAVLWSESGAELGRTSFEVKAS